MGSFRQVPHTADVALALTGVDEADLLRAGARAVTSLLCDDATPAARAERALFCSGADREERLVTFMNEVLVTALVDGFVLADVDVTVDGDEVRALARGEEDASALVVNEVKSVTYHDLAVVPGEEGLVATVVIDV